MACEYYKNCPNYSPASHYCIGDNAGCKKYDELTIEQEDRREKQARENGLAKIAKEKAKNEIKDRKFWGI
jgi:hypothetical protein